MRRIRQAVASRVDRDPLGAICAPSPSDESGGSSFLQKSEEQPHAKYPQARNRSDCAKMPAIRRLVPHIAQVLFTLEFLRHRIRGLPALPRSQAIQFSFAARRDRQSRAVIIAFNAHDNRLRPSWDDQANVVPAAGRTGNVRRALHTHRARTTPRVRIF